jgi:hypothetical protein
MTGNEQPLQSTALNYALEAAASLLSGAALAVMFGLAARWGLDVLSGTQGLQDIARLLTGGLIGVIIGAPLGPWVLARFSKRSHYSLAKGYGGALAGAVLGVLLVSGLSNAGASGAGPWAAIASIVVSTILIGNLRRRAR